MNNLPKDFAMNGGGEDAITYGIYMHGPHQGTHQQVEIIRYLLDFSSLTWKQDWHLMILIDDVQTSRAHNPGDFFHEFIVREATKFMGEVTAERLVKTTQPWSMARGDFRVMGRKAGSSIKTGSGQTLKPTVLKKDLAKQLASRSLTRDKSARIGALPDEVKLLFDPAVNERLEEPKVCEECKGTGEYECPVTTKKSPCSFGCSQPEKY